MSESGFTGRRQMVLQDEDNLFYKTKNKWFYKMRDKWFDTTKTSVFTGRRQEVLQDEDEWFYRTKSNCRTSMTMMAPIDRIHQGR
jgi:hypothetical protein